MTGERWKEVSGYEGVYQVSDQGRVKSIKSGRLRKHSKQGSGYDQVILSSNGARRTFLLHRLVAQAFISNPMNKPHINHKDGDKSNNQADNLEWCTVSENLLHRYRVLGQSGGRCRPVLCVDTGQTFPSAKAAAEALGINRAGVTQCCNDKQRTTKKLKFKFLEE